MADTFDLTVGLNESLKTWAQAHCPVDELMDRQLLSAYALGGLQAWLAGNHPDVALEAAHWFLGAAETKAITESITAGPVRLAWDEPAPGDLMDALATEPPESVEL